MSLVQQEEVIGERKQGMTLEEAFAALADGRQLRTTEVDATIGSQLAEYGVACVDGVFGERDCEFLNATTIESNLNESTRTWLRRLEVLPCTESTNSDLLERSRDMEIDGLIRVAEVQTGGRGRRGRQWVAPFAKNVALSIGVAIDRSTAEIGAISLAVGLHTATTLDRFEIDDTKLKWPNDVLIGQRKVGGILIELANAQRPARLVVGIGINVNDAPGRDVTGDYRATCIVDHADSCSRNLLVAQLIDSTYDAIRQFETSGFRGFKEAWEKRDALRGRQVVLMGVEPPIEGRGLGIDNEGAYLIQTAETVERAIGGELSLRISNV